MELEVTWQRAARVWLAFFWRSVIASLGAILAGAGLGGLIGVVLALGFHTELEDIRRLTSIIGFILGLLVSIVPLKLVLGRDYGEFRLVLVGKPGSPRP